MRLVWHIIAKDLRRFAWPIGLWLAFIAAGMIWFLWTPITLHGHAQSEASAWLWLMRIWTGLLLAGQLVMGYIFTAAFVIEDPIVGTEAFWMTRPINGRRLLFAKCGAAAVLLVAAPVAVLTPIWIADGFSLQDVAKAASRLGLHHLLVGFFALTITSLTRSLAQALLYTGIVVLVTLAVGVLPSAVMSPSAVNRADLTAISPTVLGFTGLLAALAVTRQYLTRQVTHSKWQPSATLVTCGVAIVAWSWAAFQTSEPPRATPTMKPPADTGAAISVDETFTKFSANSVPTLFVRTSWSKEGFYAPAIIRSSSGEILLYPERNWGLQAGLHELGFKAPDAPLRWQLTLAAGRTRSTQEVDEGRLEVWRARSVLAGEMSLEVGAGMKGSRPHVRIIEKVHHEDRLDWVMIEEKRPSFGANDRWDRSERGRRLWPQDHVHQYYLVDRSTDVGTYLSSGEIGSVQLNGMARGIKTLSVPATRQPADAVVARVRIERLGSFEMPVEVHGTNTRTR